MIRNVLRDGEVWDGGSLEIERDDNLKQAMKKDKDGEKELWWSGERKVRKKE